MSDELLAADADPFRCALAWRRAGRRVGLATVIETRASSPRPAGSTLAVRDDGAFVGSVSGGCLEGAVIHEAMTLMDHGGTRVLEFGAREARAWEVGLSCGGQVRILVRAVEAEPLVLAELADARAARKPVVLLTELASGRQRLVSEVNALSGPPAAAVSQALRREQPGLAAGPEGEIFAAPFLPPRRLAIVGAVHTARPLAEMARLCGFEVTIIDPRPRFASDERFPGLVLGRGWPDEELERFSLDARCALVALTHDPKVDDPALATALRSPARYIGVLGSRRTHAARCERLRQSGFTQADIERLHGPVGLAIGAGSPEEIAVAILAEMIQVWNR